MRTYEREDQPVDVLVKTTCDICGATHDAAKSGDWGYGDVDEITIRRRWCYDLEVHGFDDGVAEYDICPKCFKDRLEPWILSQGRGADG